MDVLCLSVLVSARARTAAALVSSGCARLRKKAALHPYIPRCDNNTACRPAVNTLHSPMRAPCHAVPPIHLACRPSAATMCGKRTQKLWRNKGVAVIIQAVIRQTLPICMVDASNLTWVANGRTPVRWLQGPFNHASIYTNSTTFNVVILCLRYACTPSCAPKAHTYGLENSMPVVPEEGCPRSMVCWNDITSSSATAAAHPSNNQI